MLLCACTTKLHLQGRLLLQMGGVLDLRQVKHLSELANYDVVVNCLGLGAKKLFNDDKMFPVR